MKNFSGKLIYGDAPTEQAEIEGLKRYGWTDDEITSMTPVQRRREFEEAMEIDDFLREQSAREAAAAPGLPRPEGGGQGPAEGAPGTPPEGPKSPTGGAPTEQTEELKRYAWTDEEIAGMSPAQRRRKLREAMETGQNEPTAGVIFLCAIFSVIFKQREAPQIVAGWDGISSCSFMVSLDGKRRLWLSENHFVRIEEPDQANSDGSWSVDESTGKYIVTVHGQSVTYSVVAPGDGDNCMLIKGDLATADLSRSWFYSRANLDDQSDNEPPGAR